MPPLRGRRETKAKFPLMPVLTVFVICLMYIWYMFYQTASDAVGMAEVESSLAVEHDANEKHAEAYRTMQEQPAAHQEESEPIQLSLKPAVNIPPVPKNGVPSHWTPITISGGKDPTVTLCKLDYEKYWRNPSKLPMFKDLVAASSCRGSNSKRERLSTLVAEMNADPDGTLQPSGFVFHETRCGSTLVADMLGSHPHHLTFSESTPPATAAGTGNIQVLRDVMLLMCRSHYHTKCFFKLQSINTPRIETFRKAFPDVPWAFVFREPVQVMMSHMKSSSSAVCLRQKSSPTKQHLQILGASSGRSVSREAFCAAHLAYLSQSALNSYDRSDNAMFIHYADLPDVVITTLLPKHFKAPVDQAGVDRMLETAKMYSKGRSGQSGVFTGDNHQKEKAANKQVKEAAQKYLYPSYDRCLAIVNKQAAEQ